MKKEQEFLRDSYKQRKNTAMEALRRHLGNEIVFTGTWEDGAGGQELEEEELLDGELSASIFIIGCYTVRISECVCAEVSCPDAHYADRRPSRLDKRIKGACIVTEISAKYNTGSESPADHWRNICVSVPCRERAGGTTYICTVKEAETAPDEEAALFIFNTAVTGSSTTECWYKFSPDGRVEKYGIEYGR